MADTSNNAVWIFGLWNPHTECEYELEVAFYGMDAEKLPDASIVRDADIGETSLKCMSDDGTLLEGFSWTVKKRSENFRSPAAMPDEFAGTTDTLDDMTRGMKAEPGTGIALMRLRNGGQC